MGYTAPVDFNDIVKLAPFAMLILVWIGKTLRSQPSKPKPAKRPAPGRRRTDEPEFQRDYEPLEPR